MSRNLDRQQLNRFGTIIQQLLGERKGKGRRLCSCVLVRERTIIRIPDFLTYHGRWLYRPAFGRLAIFVRSVIIISR
jgi:hypothetical protein